MSRILAAIDDSETTPTVLANATALAHATGSVVEALHVSEDVDGSMRAAAEAVGASMHEVSGEVVEQSARAASWPDVRAVVVGTRRHLDPIRPLGHVASALLTQVAPPLVVVPPTASAIVRLRRMLVPLDGTVSTADRARIAIDLATSAGIEAVILHVCAEDEMPMFSDQPQHETRAFAHEFIEHYVPAAPVSLELRVGPPADEILAAAEALEVDLIAIGWRQILEPGHARVVKELLAHSHVPLLLLPIGPADGAE